MAKSLDKFSKMQQKWLTAKDAEGWRIELVNLIRAGKVPTALEYLEIMPDTFISKHKDIIHALELFWNTSGAASQKDVALKLLKADSVKKRSRHRRRTSKEIYRDNFVLYD